MDDDPAAAAGDPILIVRRASPLTDRSGRGWNALSFEIERGGSHFLVGEPGAGKSAMLELIAMARPPARGGLELFGRDLARVRPGERYRLRRRIGMMFQDLRLIDEASAWDNVALAARAAERPRDDYGPQIDELLAWVGLAGRASAPAGELDTEGRRRLALARAVINQPDLVVADEPDGGAGLAILKLLSGLNLAGVAMLIATRDAGLASRAGADMTLLSAPAAA